MKRTLRSPRFVLAALLASGVAAAQGATVDVRAQLPDAAQRAWDAAKQLAGASDYKGALVEFQRAYELSHNPRVLFNLGVTEKFLTHYARAVEAWDRELREGGTQLTTSERQDVTNAIAIVKPFVTTVEVTANEPDATLSIDDLVVGKTPFAGPVRIDVGKHTLKLSKPDYVDSSQTVDIVAGGAAPVTFNLEPVNKTALVAVTVGGAPSATLFIDGRDVGPAPFKGQLSADRHTVEARAPGWVTVGQTVDVHYKQPMTLVLTLSQERHEGRLEVTAPEGASIALDGRSVGVGAWNGIVSTTGGHQLVVRKRGFQTYAAEVFVADDQVRDVNVPLNHEVSTSWVAWGVGSLLVVTGGIVAGYFALKPADQSPYTGTLTPGITTAGAGNFPVKYGLHR
jgi:hypothetical protein